MQPESPRPAKIAHTARICRYSAGEQANVLGMLRHAKALALAMRPKR